MKVSIECFGALKDHLPESATGNRATLELDDGGTLADLIGALGAPQRLVHAALIDGRRAGLEDRLSDGAEVTLMPPFTGGS